MLLVVVMESTTIASNTHTKVADNWYILLPSWVVANVVVTKVEAFLEVNNLEHSGPQAPTAVECLQPQARNRFTQAQKNPLLYLEEPFQHFLHLSFSYAPFLLFVPQ